MYHKCNSQDKLNQAITKSSTNLNQNNQSTTWINDDELKVIKEKNNEWLINLQQIFDDVADSFQDIIAKLKIQKKPE